MMNETEKVELEKLLDSRAAAHVEMQRLLEALPQTEEEIAQVLVEQGCLGTRGNCISCPLALYFKKHIKSPYEIGVGSVCVWMAGMAVLDMPPALRKLVASFDAGRYPQLEKQTLDG